MRWGPLQWAAAPAPHWHTALRTHLLHRVVQEREQLVVEAGDVQDAHRLGVVAQLLPRHDLKQLLQRAEPCVEWWWWEGARCGGRSGIAQRQRCGL